ncbi:MAG: tRNA (adenosine(37)-N6)-threonylcarbamoyltransferase complex transferase subunit TsaD [Betaproteobacteria bacterium]|nr:MAG: tRNA (adenosine(37)-N6)-threonylcarbamoyltransferase complex transferase subunit TsaD [Betaproteobacteria bacterium]
MIILGIESSCDETGVALYDTDAGLLGHTVHSQVALHAEYGGVVPELASRDHIRRLLPMISALLAKHGYSVRDIGGIAYTQGPGLAGALLVGGSVASALGYALSIPVVGIHHLEAHLLSPLLSSPAPEFPFVALLVSGGHTQLMAVKAPGDYDLLGETRDDAAGEAFDKTAKLLGLPYPGGPALAELAQSGNAARFRLPRPMLDQDNLDFSFSGLKTAVANLTQQLGTQQLGTGTTECSQQDKADIAAGFQEAIVDVLTAKCVRAIDTTGMSQLVVAGGVGANRRLRIRIDAAADKAGFRVFYPPVELCTDNAAMVALAGAMRIKHGQTGALPFSARPRWDLDSLPAIA